jgi:hypothetical protein
MHDVNGTPIKKGDRVLIEAIIRDTYAAPDFCNIVLAIGGDKPHGADNITSSVTLNSRQVLLFKRSQ